MAEITKDVFLVEAQNFLSGFKGWVIISNGDIDIIIPNYTEGKISTEVETTEDIPNFDAAGSTSHAYGMKYTLDLTHYGISFLALVGFYNGSMAVGGNLYQNEELTVALNKVTTSEDMVERSPAVYWVNPVTGEIYFFKRVTAAATQDGEFYIDYDTSAVDINFFAGAIDDDEKVRVAYAYDQAVAGAEVILSNEPSRKPYTVTFYSGRLNPNTGEFTDGRVVGRLQRCACLKPPDIVFGPKASGPVSSQFALNGQIGFTTPAATS